MPLCKSRRRRRRRTTDGAPSSDSVYPLSLSPLSLPPSVPLSLSRLLDRPHSRVSTNHISLNLIPPPPPPPLRTEREETAGRTTDPWMRVKARIKMTAAGPSLPFPGILVTQKIYFPLTNYIFKLALLSFSFSINCQFFSSYGLVYLLSFHSMVCVYIFNSM